MCDLKKKKKSQYRWQLMWQYIYIYKFRQFDISDFFIQEITKETKLTKDNNQLTKLKCQELN